MNAKSLLLLYFTIAIGKMYARLPDATGSDTAVVRAYLEKAAKIAAGPQPDSAEFYYKQAGELASRISYHEGILEYLGKYTGLLYGQMRYQEALELSKQQLARSRQFQDKRKEANAFNNIAVCYQALGDLKLAAENFMQALMLSEDLKDPVNQQKFYTNISSIFYDMNDTARSLYYARKGHEVALTLNDPGRVSRSLVNLIISEVINKQYDSALAHSMQIVQMGDDAEPDVRASAYINLGEIYNRLGKHAEAIKWFGKAKDLEISMGSAEYDAHIRSGLARSYSELRQYKTASNYFDGALELAEKQFPKSELRDLYAQGAQIKEALGLTGAALELLKKYNILNDSLSGAATQTAIQELDIRYRSSLKEKALAEQQLQIARQQGEIKEKNRLLFLYAAAAIILALTGITVYFIFSQKRKTAEAEKKNQLLMARLDGEERERSRTARELHDGVGAVLSAASMHMHAYKGARTDAPASAPFANIISMIEHALKEIRNISHNLAPEILLNEGLEYAVKTYCARITSPALEIEQYTIGQIPRLAPDQELLIYRIIQESVTNIIKHARASQAIVQLSYDSGMLTVTVEDDGDGFDISRHPGKGLGLNNLLERINLLQGNHQIRSVPGQGTTIYLELLVAEKVPAVTS